MKTILSAHSRAFQGERMILGDEYTNAPGAFARKGEQPYPRSSHLRVARGCTQARPHIAREAGTRPKPGMIRLSPFCAPGSHDRRSNHGRRAALRGVPISPACSGERTGGIAGGGESPSVSAAPGISFDLVASPSLARARDVTREIPLTKGFVALVDDEDFERVNAFKWHFLRGRRGGYAARRGRDSHVVLMHREILGAPDGVPVDHISGDGLDNRRANLRECSNAENARNQVKHKAWRGRPCTSQYKGVHFNRADQRWVSMIRENGRSRYLGGFLSEIEAALAYDTAAKQVFGEFARFNFPDGGG